MTMRLVDIGSRGGATAERLSLFESYLGLAKGSLNTRVTDDDMMTAWCSVFLGAQQKDK